MSKALLSGFVESMRFKTSSLNLNSLLFLQVWEIVLMICCVAISVDNFPWKHVVMNWRKFAKQFTKRCAILKKFSTVMTNTETSVKLSTQMSAKKSWNTNAKQSIKKSASLRTGTTHPNVRICHRKCATMYPKTCVPRFQRRNVQRRKSRCAKQSLRSPAKTCRIRSANKFQELHEQR